ncbi:MAG: hypothetical protein G01um101444_227 [Parcubacteria group bacterium Gr01-1014_44]|nr:MAG: hypothetical protein G01um101444_227 [Parcubacteria group bacterium Gr01-1014_44]
MKPQTAVAEHVKLGMFALDLLETIFCFYELKLAEVVKYQCEEKPHFDEAKKLNPKAQRSVTKALQHTPDFIEPSFFIQELKDFESIDLAMEKLREIDSNQVTIASYVEQANEKIRIHEALKAISKVKTREGIFHIPLLNLDIPVDENGVEKIKEVALGLGIEHAAVLNSGRSYHFWGLELLSEEEWRRFMYRALLLDRIGRRWVGHRLIDGQANLRISEKGGHIPTVVHVF